MRAHRLDDMVTGKFNLKLIVACISCQPLLGLVQDFKLFVIIPVICNDLKITLFIFFTSIKVYLNFQIMIVLISKL